MPSRHPSLSNAFGATFAALLFLVPGLMGYELHKSNWSFVRVTSAGAPVAWEIQLGALASLLAIYFWRKALRELR